MTVPSDNDPFIGDILDDQQQWIVAVALRFLNSNLDSLTDDLDESDPLCSITNEGIREVAGALCIDLYGD